MLSETSPPPSAARISRATAREERPRRRQPSPVRLEMCRQHYTRLLRSRQEIPAEQQVPHRGPITWPSGGRFRVKLCFGNLTPIPSQHELDLPPYNCLNYRKKCRYGGHKVMDCDETYLVHSENCGWRGVAVSECPRCSEAYFRDGWHFEPGQSVAGLALQPGDNRLVPPFGRCSCQRFRSTLSRRAEVWVQALHRHTENVYE